MCDPRVQACCIPGILGTCDTFNITSFTVIRTEMRWKKHGWCFVFSVYMNAVVFSSQPYRLTSVLDLLKVNRQQYCCLGNLGQVSSHFEMDGGAASTFPDLGLPAAQAVVRNTVADAVTTLQHLCFWVGQVEPLRGSYNSLGFLKNTTVSI